MFEYTKTDTKAPAEVAFENESKDAETYYWEFGDGDTSTLAEPKHRYTSSGNYEVTLTARKGKKKNTMSERIQIKPPTRCLVEISTDYGNMIVELYDATPKHKDNFVKLVEEGYYDGLLFHRVIQDFMIQGGDPDSKEAKPGQPLGMGGPGYQVDAEFVDSLVHVKGALAAARTGGPSNPLKKSSGSQFYIVQGRDVTERDLNGIEAARNFRYTSAQREAYLEQGGTPFLDREYTVFGQVIEGLDVVDKITAVMKDGRDRPKEDVQMTMRVIK